MKVWRCRDCEARTKTSSDTWPELRPEPNGHVHRWERAPRGRPRKDVDEPAADVELAAEKGEVDEEDEGITVRRVIPKTGRCLDCGTAIRAISKRCRPCAGKEWGRRAKAKARAARVLRERQKR